MRQGEGDAALPVAAIRVVRCSGLRTMGLSNGLPAKLCWPWLAKDSVSISSQTQVGAK